MSECFGAGTGCGWCRPFLQRLFDQAVAAGYMEPDSAASQRDALPSETEYANGRSRYVRAGGGTPPAGATPIDPSATGADGNPATGG